MNGRGDSTKKTIRSKSEFNKIDIQKPILFLYPTSHHVEFEIYKTYHLQ